MSTITSPAESRPAAPAAPPPTAASLRSLDEVAPSDWDALLSPGMAPLRHGFLRSWERAELTGLCSRPVVVREGRDGAPVAACPGYFYDLDVATVRFPASLPAVGVVRRWWRRFGMLRTYELGTPVPLTRPLLVRGGDLGDPAVSQLLATAAQTGLDGGASFVLVQNFTATDGPAGRTLAELGFAAVPIPATAVVDLPYGSFEDYLAAMRAQYRRRAQKTLKRSERLTVEHHEQFEDLADELARLWRAIYERAREVRREILTPDFFRGASAVPETSVLLLRRPDGTIASFALLLDERPWLSFDQCGFEADAGRGEGAYFRLLYELVRHAIEHGYEQLDLGITTLAPKLDVGAVPVPLFAWLKHRNPVVQAAMRALARGPLRPPELAPRRVFKQAPPPARELVARRGLPS